jgi:hypothetical protein
MRALITLVLVLTGCSLVVGTEPRYVAEGGTTDAGPDVDTTSCKNDCQNAYAGCIQKCPLGGPAQKPCDDSCKSTQQNCDETCGP